MFQLDLSAAVVMGDRDAEILNALSSPSRGLDPQALPCVGFTNRFTVEEIRDALRRLHFETAKLLQAKRAAHAAVARELRAG